MQSDGLSKRVTKITFIPDETHTFRANGMVILQNKPAVAVSS